MSTSTRKKMMSMTKHRTRRYHQWWSLGKRDGLCGMLKGAGEIPGYLKEAYGNGHTYGMLIRGEVVL